MFTFLASLPAIFWVRFGFVALCLSALALIVKKQREVLAGLKKFLLEPSHPANLGLLRIIVFCRLFSLSLTNPAAWFASLSPNFVQLPRGWEWLADVYPVAIRWVRPEERLFVVASALAMLGLFTRVSTIAASLLGLWLMGITNFYFKIGHDSHVPELCALLLACSPCGDALSLDSVIRRFRAPRRLEPNVAYTVPVRFSWLLLGTMYLFPGLWKLWESGERWISGDMLKTQLLLKWTQLPDYVPTVRVDQSQLALAFLGVMTLVVEIGIFFAMFNRTTRVLAGIQASLFHLGVGLMMDIWFNIYFPLIVLIDFPEVLTVPPFRWVRAPLVRLWDGLGARAVKLVPRLATEPSEVLVPPPPGASFLAGSMLLLGMFIAGIGPIDSWPISVYPRFSDHGARAERTSFGLSFVAKPPDGPEKELHIEFRPFEDTAGVFRIVRAAINAKKRGHQAELDEDVALIARVVRENSPPMPKGTRLFIYRFDFTVDPADRANDQRRPSLIAETDL